MLSSSAGSRSLHYLPSLCLRCRPSFCLSRNLGPRTTYKPRRHSVTAQNSTLVDNEWRIEDAGDKQAWLRKDLHVVLVEAKIPQNVGNIARTCAASRVGLHLVGPLGFEVDDRKIKRAGLDYWDYVAVKVYENWQVTVCQEPSFERWTLIDFILPEFQTMFEELQEPKRLIGFSKFSNTHYAAEGFYCKGDWLLFGAETTGFPDEVHEKIPASGGVIVKIPMEEKHVRSLNLATSVGIGLYEAKRQLDGTVL